MEDNTLIREFTNSVHSSATPELLEFLAQQGIPWDVFKSASKPISEVHDRQDTPLFAGIERHDSSRLRPLQPEIKASGCRPRKPMIVTNVDIF